MVEFLDKEGLQYFYANKVVGRKQNAGEIFNDLDENVAGSSGFRVINAFTSQNDDGTWGEGRFIVDFSTDAAKEQVLKLKELVDSGVTIMYSANIQCFVESLGEPRGTQVEDWGKIIEITYENEEDLPGGVLPVATIRVDKGFYEKAHGYWTGDNFYTPTSYQEGSDINIIRFNAYPEIGDVRIIAPYAHAEGCETKAIGGYSHTEGYDTLATGKYSHAEGRKTKAAYAAHAEGNETKAFGQNSHTEGYKTETDAYHSHAEGRETKALAEASHSEGEFTQATGKAAHAEGSYSQARGPKSHAEGAGTTASGLEGAHAEGRSTIASGDSSHAEGRGTETRTEASHAEGYGSKAYAIAGHSEGFNTLVQENAKGGHAEGIETTAGFNGSTEHEAGSHAEGIKTKALGGYGSHAEGRETEALGQTSHTEGYLTKATSRWQHVEGTKNIPDDSNRYIHIAGNGYHKGELSNAYVLDVNGNAHYAGAIYANSTFTQNGTRFERTGDQVATQKEVATSISNINSSINTLKSDFNNTINSLITRDSTGKLTLIGNGAKAYSLQYGNNVDGKLIEATEMGSIAFGAATKATNYWAMAVGSYSEANGNASFAAGNKAITSTNVKGQVVLGNNNVVDNEAQFVVGCNGKNGLTVKTNGDVYTYGAVYANNKELATKEYVDSRGVDGYFDTYLDCKMEGHESSYYLWNSKNLFEQDSCANGLYYIEICSEKAHSGTTTTGVPVQATVNNLIYRTDSGYILYSGFFRYTHEPTSNSTKYINFPYTHLNEKFYNQSGEFGQVIASGVCLRPVINQRSGQIGIQISQSPGGTGDLPTITNHIKNVGLDTFTFSRYHIYLKRL